MANKHRDIDEDRLIELADEYCDYCVESTKEVATGSGKIVKVAERHIPTISYFLLHWLRREHKDFYMLKRSQFYLALREDDHPLSHTIKNIDENFKTLASDIVANEGKGIFYAKNKLGWSDKMQSENITNIKLINLDPLDDSNDNGTT